MTVTIPFVEVVVVLVSLILIVAAQMRGRGMVASPNRDVVPLIVIALVIEFVIQTTRSPSGLARVVIARRSGTGALASRARPAAATAAATALARLSLVPFLAGAGAFFTRIQGRRRPGKILTQLVEKLRGAWLVVGGVVEVVVERPFRAARGAPRVPRGAFARRGFPRLAATLSLAATPAPATTAAPARFVCCLAPFLSGVGAHFARLFGALLGSFDGRLRAAAPRGVTPFVGARSVLAFGCPSARRGRGRGRGWRWRRRVVGTADVARSLKLGLEELRSAPLRQAPLAAPGGGGGGP